MLGCDWFGDADAAAAHKRLQVRDQDNRTALAHAVHAGYLDIAVPLLNKELHCGRLAKLEAQTLPDELQEQALALLRRAAQEGEADAVQKLLQVVDVTKGSPGTDTLLMQAARAGHADVVAKLLAAGPALASQLDADGASALWHAVAEGQQAVVRALLDASVDVSQLFNTAGVDALARGASKLEAGTRSELVNLLRTPAGSTADRKAAMRASNAAQEGAVIGLGNKAAKAARPIARVRSVFAWMDIGLKRLTAPLARSGAELKQEHKRSTNDHDANKVIREYAARATLLNHESKDLPDHYYVLTGSGMTRGEATDMWERVGIARHNLAVRKDHISIIAFRSSSNDKEALLSLEGIEAVLAVTAEEVSEYKTAAGTEPGLKKSSELEQAVSKEFEVLGVSLAALTKKQFKFPQA